MRAFRGVAQYFAQTVDSFFECQFVVDEGVVRPEALPEFIAGDDFAGAFEQSLQDLERLARELLTHAAFADFAGGQVYFKDAEPYDTRRAGAGGNSWLR